MDQNFILDIARQGIMLAFTISLPILGVALVIGVLVSIFQAITQVQEMTLTFLPKLLGVVIVGILLGNWMITKLVAFMQFSFEHMARLSR